MFLFCTTPVACWYFCSASALCWSQCHRERSEKGALTGNDQREGGASVDDASGAGQDTGAAVGDRLIDTPVGRRGRGARQAAVKTTNDAESSQRACNLQVADGAGELARVGAVKGELAVRDSCLSCGFEGAGDDLRGDSALEVEVVGDYR